MPHLGVTAVERLRVDAVQVPHQQRQVRQSRVQHEVIVVAHQAIGQYLGIKTGQPRRHHTQQRVAIHVVHKDQLAPVAARCNVVDHAGELDAKRAGHR